MTELSLDSKLILHEDALTGLEVDVIEATAMILSIGSIRCS